MCHWQTSLCECLVSNAHLDFHFYLSSRGWRIYDVTSNGMSAVDGLRKSYFANLFKREEPVGLRSNLPPAGRGAVRYPAR